MYADPDPISSAGPQILLDQDILIDWLTENSRNWAKLRQLKIATETLAWNMSDPTTLLSPEAITAAYDQFSESLRLTEAISVSPDIIQILVGPYFDDQGTLTPVRLITFYSMLEDDPDTYQKFLHDEPTYQSRFAMALRASGLLQQVDSRMSFPPTAKITNTLLSWNPGLRQVFINANTKSASAAKLRRLTEVEKMVQAGDSIVKIRNALPERNGRPMREANVLDYWESLHPHVRLANVRTFFADSPSRLESALAEPLHQLQLQKLVSARLPTSEFMSRNVKIRGFSLMEPQTIKSQVL